MLDRPKVCVSLPRPGVPQPPALAFSGSLTPTFSFNGANTIIPWQAFACNMNPESGGIVNTLWEDAAGHWHEPPILDNCTGSFDIDWTAPAEPGLYHPAFQVYYHDGSTFRVEGTIQVLPPLGP